MKIINADGSETLVDREYAKRELRACSTPMLTLMKDMYRDMSEDGDDPEPPWQMIDVINELLAERDQMFERLITG